MIWIRPAHWWSLRDVRFLRTLHNAQPSVHAISWREHGSWWMWDWPPICYLLIVKGQRCGYLRVRENGILSVAIDRHLQGHALGRYLLVYAQKKKPQNIPAFIAAVRRDNLPSHHLFQFCQFEVDAQTGTHIIYRWPARRPKEAV